MNSLAPQLETERLLLREFTLNDAPRVQELCSDFEIADTTATIPHPYPEGAAEEWIKTHRPGFEAGELANFAVVLKESDEIIGTVGLVINKTHSRAELGYWIGKEYWGRGYCTEAARALVDWGFKELSLNRIFACYYKRNPASGRVQEKIGMKYEGTLRQHIKKWENYEDVAYMGILRSDWEGCRSNNQSS
ncbi:MAG: N-acetyltransferase [Candidatus Dadabacteria bacterium]|nr:MAG: N-acetyltransferase [Candidatus Dadabacteria bacterium]